MKNNIYKFHYSMVSLLNYIREANNIERPFELGVDLLNEKCLGMIITLKDIENV